ncbi:ROK family protein [Streptococcus sp. X16XC17]|uniref:ROK family protein n=1 Tax=Streptococcus sp. X16XC17 TaxID=2316646 RepID=UPI00103DE29D|nr:ROK family protein [Streptococcus sp. X16XC17]
MSWIIVLIFFHPAGCLQTYASESWLLKKATLLAQSHVSTFLKNILDNQTELNLNHLFLAYDYGDIEVINLLHQAIKYLVQVLLNLGNLIDANKIFIHSPLFNHKTLEVELYRLLNEYSSDLLGNPQKILIDPYDDFRGSLGGAALAIYKTSLEF